MAKGRLHQPLVIVNPLVNLTSGWCNRP